MTYDLMELKEKQDLFLNEEKIKYPELFPELTWEDDAETLAGLGIYIPGKETMPSGFIKILPSDFIVEEITSNNQQTTIHQNDSNTSDKPGNTIYATLVKCNMSTLEAVEEIAKMLKIGKNQIQYAGIKDKAAITSQLISFRGVSKDRILSLSSPFFFLKNIYTGKGVIEKGGLKGNRFSILIRTDKPINKLSLQESINNVKNKGFYNFYYLQRFGTPRLNNFKWGISILRGDYEEAVLGMIGDPGLREIPYFIKKREEIISLAPDWRSILQHVKEMPLAFSNEIKVLNHLINNPQDFVGALKKIDDQVMLWIAAVGSLLFNLKLSNLIIEDVEPPTYLPLFLSDKKSDWETYHKDLESINLAPPPFHNLRPFRNIQLRERRINTTSKAEIHSMNVVPEGIAINFTLDKGEYATTLLSHFITLANGKTPNNLTTDLVDVKKVLSEESMQSTLDYFSAINTSRE